LGKFKNLIDGGTPPKGLRRSGRVRKEGGAVIFVVAEDLLQKPLLAISSVIVISFWLIIEVISYL
jgi:hypothetical protein